MKKNNRVLISLTLAAPSLCWCVLLARYAAADMLPAWAAFAGIILNALVSGIIWKTAQRPSIVEEVARMPLYDLLCLLNERSDIHKVVINELEGTDYHEEPEDNA